jgi:hypothetical protein
MNPRAHGPRQQLSEGSGVAFVSSPECPQIFRPFVLVDDRGGVAATHQQQRQHESSRAAVPVWEWVDALKGSVEGSELVDDVRLGPFA